MTQPAAAALRVDTWQRSQVTALHGRRLQVAGTGSWRDPTSHQGSRFVPLNRRTLFGVHALACPQSPNTLKGGHQACGSWVG